MSVLQLKPLVTAPLAISAWVVWPCSPDSALSPLRQCATGTDAAASAGSSVSSAATQEDSIVVFMSLSVEGDCERARPCQSAADGFKSRRVKLQAGVQENDGSQTTDAWTRLPAAVTCASPCVPASSLRSVSPPAL